MILTEYDEEEFREFLKEESWKEGHESGKSEGIEIGKFEGAIEGTIKTCLDFQISDTEIIAKLIHDYSLSEEDASTYLNKYKR